MGKSASPPPTPDYASAATAQGAANVEAARSSAKLSNPNIVGPYGNQTVQYGSGANIDIPTVTQTLTPEGQATVEAQQRVSRQLANLGEQGIGRAQQVLRQPFNYTGPAIQTSLGQQRPLNYGPEMGQYGTAESVNADQYGNLMSSADMSGVAAMPVNAGMTGQQAIMNRLAPQLARQSAATQQQLANQGITSGSEAYRNAMTQEQQGQNDLLSQAALQGISLDMGANQQGYGQAMGQANLYNQTLGQGFGQASQAQQMRNAAMAQNYGQAGTLGGLFNQTVGQNFNQGLSAAQFGNTAGQDELQRQAYLRQQPLNEITGLMSGSQIQLPQFQAYQGQQIAPAPIFAGAQAAGQNAMQSYGIDSANVNARNAGLMSGLGTVGQFAVAGAKAGMFSDRRLKSGIRRIGTHKLGIGLYEYTIFGQRQRGVMADEVESVMPSAVILHPSGYKMVDYNAIGGINV